MQEKSNGKEGVHVNVEFKVILIGEGGVGKTALVKKDITG